MKPPTGTPVFDVTYTIDSWGNRSAPEAPGRPAVVFFGCSFAFGAGVEDDETLPWQFALDVGGQFDVVNAALSGYGAHHMLRMLEIGLLDGRVPSGVARAFYSAIPDHVRRARRASTGTSSGPATSSRVVMWDFGTPRGRRLGAELRRHGLDVVLVSDLLPPAQVRFIPGDGHPTASTDAALARALARRYFPRPGTPD